MSTASPVLDLTAQPRWFAVANLISTLLLGMALVLGYEVVSEMRERVKVKRRDKQAIAMLVSSGLANTALDAFLSESSSPSLTLLFASRLTAYVARTLVLLFLIQHLTGLALLKRRYRAGFAAFAAALSVFAGGAMGWAIFEVILMNDATEPAVELAGLAAVSSATAVLASFTIILFRSSAGKLLSGAVALALLAQIAESLFWTVHQTWVWMVTLPLGNAYMLLLLFVTLSSAPRGSSNEPYANLPSPENSPRSQTAALPPTLPPLEAHHNDDRPCLDSRWSSETDTRRKGLKTILKSATPAARRAGGGHFRNDSAVNTLNLQVEVNGYEENHVRFAPRIEQQQQARLAPKPSFRSLLRSPSSTAAGKPDPSPSSSFSSTTTDAFPPPPSRTPARSATYPPPPVPNLPRAPLPMPSQQHFRFPPHRPVRTESSELPYAFPYGAAPGAAVDTAVAPNRLVNPYSPALPPSQTSSIGGEVVLDLREDHRRRRL